MEDIQENGRLLQLPKPFSKNLFLFRFPDWRSSATWEKDPTKKKKTKPKKEIHVRAFFFISREPLFFLLEVLGQKNFFLIFQTKKEVFKPSVYPKNRTKLGSFPFTQVLIWFNNSLFLLSQPTRDVFNSNPKRTRKILSILLTLLRSFWWKRVLLDAWSNYW